MHRAMTATGVNEKVVNMKTLQASLLQGLQKNSVHSVFHVSFPYAGYRCQLIVI